MGWLHTDHAIIRAIARRLLGNQHAQQNQPAQQNQHAGVASLLCCCRPLCMSSYTCSSTAGIVRQPREVSPLRCPTCLTATPQLSKSCVCGGTATYTELRLRAQLRAQTQAQTQDSHARPQSLGMTHAFHGRNVAHTSYDPPSKPMGQPQLKAVDAVSLNPRCPAQL